MARFTNTHELEGKQKNAVEKGSRLEQHFQDITSIYGNSNGSSSDNTQAAERQREYLKGNERVEFNVEPAIAREKLLERLRGLVKRLMFFVIKLHHLPATMKAQMQSLGSEEIQKSNHSLSIKAPTSLLPSSKLS